MYKRVSIAETATCKGPVHITRNC